ncbi:hypothetical protein HOD08_01370 [bacterium]|jgi:V/A-type H+/Na+-transporting ATPase subunit E|nr:hypothetical protein [bacterium]
MALKDILDQIKKTAEAEIAKLDKERDASIARITADYEAKRKTRKIEMDSKIENNCVKVKDRAKIFAKMETRNLMLRKKREILEKVYQETLESIVSSDSYINVVSALLKKAAGEFNEGTIIPAKGKESETKKALDASGAPFNLSQKTAPIRGGFILTSGKVEVDFSVESVLQKELWGELEMQLNQLLFP